jgi:hypothetical protein
MNHEGTKDTLWFIFSYLLILDHVAMIYLIATAWVKIVENESLFFLP